MNCNFEIITDELDYICPVELHEQYPNYTDTLFAWIDAIGVSVAATDSENDMKSFLMAYILLSNDSVRTMLTAQYTTVADLYPAMKQIIEDYVHIYHELHTIYTFKHTNTDTAIDIAWPLPDIFDILIQSRLDSEPVFYTDRFKYIVQMMQYKLPEVEIVLSDARRIKSNIPTIDDFNAVQIASSFENLILWQIDVINIDPEYFQFLHTDPHVVPIDLTLSQKSFTFIDILNKMYTVRFNQSLPWDLPYAEFIDKAIQPVERLLKTSIPATIRGFAIVAMTMCNKNTIQRLFNESNNQPLLLIAKIHKYFGQIHKFIVTVGTLFKFDEWTMEDHAALFSSASILNKRSDNSIDGGIQHLHWIMAKRAMGLHSPSSRDESCVASLMGQMMVKPVFHLLEPIERMMLLLGHLSEHDKQFIGCYTLNLQKWIKYMNQYSEHALREYGFVKKINVYADHLQDVTNLICVDLPFLSQANLSYRIWNNTDNTSGTCCWHVLATALDIRVEELVRRSKHAIHTNFTRPPNCRMQTPTTTEKFRTPTKKSSSHTIDLEYARRLDSLRSTITRRVARRQDKCPINLVDLQTLVEAACPHVAVFNFNVDYTQYDYDLLLRAGQPLHSLTLFRTYPLLPGSQLHLLPPIYPLSGNVIKRKHIPNTYNTPITKIMFTVTYKLKTGGHIDIVSLEDAPFQSQSTMCYDIGMLEKYIPTIQNILNA